MGVGVYSTMYLALHYADGVSVILICTQFSVPVSSFLGIWLLKERPSKKIWFGIWLAFAGVMAAGFDYAILGYWPASLLILLSATFYAGANALSRRLRNAINVLNLNAWMGLISTPIYWRHPCCWKTDIGNRWQPPTSPIGRRYCIRLSLCL